MQVKNLNSICALALFAMSGMALADSSIWSTGVDGQSLASNAAAKFVINGGTTLSSASTVVSYYTATGCTNLQSSLSTNGVFNFVNPTANLQANSLSIYNFNQAGASAVLSIQVIPKTSAGGGGSNVFTTTPCFDVTCSAQNGCVYSGVAQAVSLPGGP